MSRSKKNTDREKDKQTRNRHLNQFLIHLDNCRELEKAETNIIKQTKSENIQIQEMQAELTQKMREQLPKNIKKQLEEKLKKTSEIVKANKTIKYRSPYEGRLFSEKRKSPYQNGFILNERQDPTKKRLWSVTPK